MALQPPVTWFHGGCPGLQPGDLILPPARSGIPKATGHPSLVYLTADVRYATGYAAFWSICPLFQGDGWVYRVQPDKPVPVQGTHPQAACSQATVLEVIMRGVTREAGLALEPPIGEGVAAEAAEWSAWRLRGGRLPPPVTAVVRAGHHFVNGSEVCGICGSGCLATRCGRGGAGSWGQSRASCSPPWTRITTGYSGRPARAGSVPPGAHSTAIPPRITARSAVAAGGVANWT